MDLCNHSFSCILKAEITWKSKSCLPVFSSVTSGLQQSQICPPLLLQVLISWEPWLTQVIIRAVGYKCTQRHHKVLIYHCIKADIWENKQMNRTWTSLQSLPQEFTGCLEAPLLLHCLVLRLLWSCNFSNFPDTWIFEVRQEVNISCRKQWYSWGRK